MGLGVCRWAFPIHSSSADHHPPLPVQLQDASSEHIKVCFLHSVLGNSCSKSPSSPRSSTCSYSQLSLGKHSAIEKFSLSGECFNSSVILRTSGEPSSEEPCSSASRSLENEFLQFSLLVDNLDKIEDALSDAYLIELKKDILIHMGRLGAEKLFQSCFLKSFYYSHAQESSLLQEMHLNDCTVARPSESQMQNVVVRSMKKESRKLKRNKTNIVEALIVSSNASGLSRSDFVNYSSVHASPSHSNGKQLARVESKLSEGVREFAFLRRIHQKLEEINGKPPTLAMWAKAAGIDKKILHQRLHFGWLCQGRLLKSTRSLVIYHSKNYSGMGVCFHELVQAGHMGVLLGAERFDSARGCKFSTYIHHWIKKFMSLFVFQHSRGILVPARIRKINKQIEKAKLSNGKGKFLNDDDIAEITGLSLTNIRLANKCSMSIGSLDQKLRGHSNLTFMDIFQDTSIESPEAATMKQHLKNDLQKLLEGLRPREKQVLLLRYGFVDGRCRSLSEIGDLAHVSKAWIRKIEKAALEKLRKEEIQVAMKYYL